MDDFVKLVAEMREKQREYFRTRDGGVLKESKALERRVDAEVERLTDPNPSLFPTGHAREAENMEGTMLTLPKIKAAPRDLIGPACYARPDGSLRTVLGSVRGLLALDGRHCEAEPTEWDKPFGGRDRGPMPRTTELILGADRKPLGPVDPAAWLALAADCDVPTTEMLPGSVECVECSGTGDHYYGDCDRDGDCKPCCGKGVVYGPPEPTDVYPAPRVLRFAGRHYELQNFAALLRLLPAGPAEAFDARGNLHLVGPGYTLLVPAMTEPLRLEDDVAVLDWPPHPQTEG